MAKSTIQSIREAELKAQKILKKAGVDKEDIIEKAKNEGAAFAKDLLGKAQEKAKAELSEVEATRDGALEEASKKAEGIISQLASSAKAKREDAIRMVIEEIA